MTVHEVEGRGAVLLPASYVREHVELAYASTAHRAQGRTVDTAHALVSPTTTREVLYVSATRGARGEPSLRGHPLRPRSSDRPRRGRRADHGPRGPRRGAAQRGADVAAHEVIRREQAEAEGMERLSAEYLTLATLAQAERWDALLAARG